MRRRVRGVPLDSETLGVGYYSFIQYGENVVACC